MDLDDNFDDDEDTTSESTRTGVRLPRRMTNMETTSSTEITTDQIVDTVLQGLGQTYRPPVRHLTCQDLVLKCKENGAKCASGILRMRPKIAYT